MTIAVPVELATFDAAFGVKTAVSCSGDVEAANDVWHMAVNLDGVIGSATQLAIAAPPFANAMVPDGEPALELTTANNVTPSFVTAAAGNATSDRALPLAVWVSWDWTLRLAEVSVAVSVTGPGVPELLISALYVPFPLSATCRTFSPGSEEENTTVSVGTGLP